MSLIERDPIPEGRRPPECPGTCSCRLVCGQAVIDGRLNPAPSATTQGAVAENEKLRLQVAALENDGMELAAKLGEAEERIARLTAPGGQ